MLQFHNLLKRAELKHHSAVKSSLRSFWESLPYEFKMRDLKTSELGIHRGVYVHMNEAIHQMLVPGVSDADARDVAMKDWEADMGHGKRL